MKYCENCNSELLLKKEDKTIDLKGTRVTIKYHFYFCANCQKEFLFSDIISLNEKQKNNLYREKRNILFPEEIKLLRKNYGLSPSKMAQLLSFGINVYRNYESGEIIPSPSNANLLKIMNNPEFFERYINLLENNDGLTDILTPGDVEQLKFKISELKNKQNSIALGDGIKVIFKNWYKPNSKNGFRMFDFERFGNMIIYFLEKTNMSYRTYLNKLLFYSDFLNYKRTVTSITGIEYRAIKMGPVPSNYDIFYDILKVEKFVNVELVEFNDSSNMVEKLVPAKQFNPVLFSEEEMKTINEVIKAFTNTKAQELINRSHQEDAWLENHLKNEIIDYQYAFSLKPF